MADYDHSKLPNETLVFILTSTFGNGDAPQNAEVYHYLLVFCFVKCNICKFSDFCKIHIKPKRYKIVN